MHFAWLCACTKVLKRGLLSLEYLNAENLTCGEAGCACLTQRQTGSAPPRAFTSIH